MEIYKQNLLQDYYRNKVFWALGTGNNFKTLPTFEEFIKKIETQDQNNKNYENTKDDRTTAEIYDDLVMFFQGGESN